MWANKRIYRNFAEKLLYMKTFNKFNELTIEPKTIQKPLSASLITKLLFFLSDFVSIFPKHLPV